MDIGDRRCGLLSCFLSPEAAAAAAAAAAAVVLGGRSETAAAVTVAVLTAAAEVVAAAHFALRPGIHCTLVCSPWCGGGVSALTVPTCE